MSRPSYPSSARSVSCGLKPMERSAARASSMLEDEAPASGSWPDAGRSAAEKPWSFASELLSSSMRR